MKRLMICLVSLFSLLHGPVQAQSARYYQPAEIESLLAPIALYPDAVIGDILAASSHPADVIQAARAPNTPNPAWHPSVQNLLAFPEVLDNMASSPAWMYAVSNAYLAQSAQVMGAVQVLRQRAQASGIVPDSSYPYQAEPAFLPYYDPLVVYGAWRPAYRVVYWRPWPRRRIFVSNNYQRLPASTGTQAPIALRGNGPPSPAIQLQAQIFAQRQAQVHTSGVTPYVRVPESQRQPAVQSAPRLHQEVRHDPARGAQREGRHEHKERERQKGS